MDKSTFFLNLAKTLTTMDFNKIKSKYPFVDNISCDNSGTGFYCIVSVKENIPPLEDKKKITNMVWEVVYDSGTRIPPHNINVSFKKK